MKPLAAAGSITIERLIDGGADTLASDVLDGLSRSPKQLPPKHFYDATGAELFDRICELPEYYPTRAERAILERVAGGIAARTGASELLELGSGTAAKTRVLLDALSAHGSLRRYLPVDVTESMIERTAGELTAEYPGISVHGLVCDFDRGLADTLPAARGPRLVAFLGGTIGNFEPRERRLFLRQLAATLGPADHLLLGADLVKDVETLEAAYNDSAGVTAEFNRNVLSVINARLGADFDLSAFEHVAFFDREHEWIEMRLRSKRSQLVSIPRVGMNAWFAEGEELRTEISAKFTRERMAADLGAAGLRPLETYTDEEGLFALVLAGPSRS